MTYALLAFFVALNIADWFTTDYVLKRGGVEANPLANAILKRFGTIGMGVYKTLGVSIIVGAILKWPELWLALLLLIPGYSYILFNNLRVARNLAEDEK